MKLKTSNNKFLIRDYRGHSCLALWNNKLSIHKCTVFFANIQCNPINTVFVLTACKIHLRRLYHEMRYLDFRCARIQLQWAHNQDRATLILRLCQGAFTDKTKNNLVWIAVVRHINKGRDLRRACALIKANSLPKVFETDFECGKKICRHRRKWKILLDSLSISYALRAKDIENTRISLSKPDL